MGKDKDDSETQIKKHQEYVKEWYRTHPKKQRMARCQSCGKEFLYRDWTPPLLCDACEQGNN